MFLLPILMGAGIFYLFALTIHYTSNSDNKAQGIVVFMFWANVIGLIASIMFGGAALVSHMSGISAADTLSSIAGLVFFTFVGFLIASGVTIYRAND